jgi:hypothetical protein
MTKPYENEAYQQFVKNFGRQPIPGENGGELNAYTHAYVSAKFVKNINNNTFGIAGNWGARQAGNINEWRLKPLSDREKYERAKDQYNNAVGRKIGSQQNATNDSNGKHVADTLRNGGLRLKADSPKEFEHNPNGEAGHWVTINGNHIFIKN